MPAARGWMYLAQVMDLWSRTIGHSHNDVFDQKLKREPRPDAKDPDHFSIRIQRGVY